MILSSEAGLLCESWMRVSYLAGINGGARLAEVWSVDEDLWMDKKQNTFLQPQNTTLHHLVALLWNNVYIMMWLKQAEIFNLHTGGCRKHFPPTRLDLTK